jgi:hypothetical protein
VSYSLSEEAKLGRILEKLNTNIEILTKVTALTFRKDSLFKGKDTKPEQIEVLDEMNLPDDVIALIIGSTVNSVQTQRRQARAKARKAQAETTKPEKKEETVPTSTKE